jgi:enolase
MVRKIIELANTPISSIEDPFDQEDWELRKITEGLGKIYR